LSLFAVFFADESAVGMTRVEALVQVRYSSPLWRRSGADEITQPRWEVIAERLNSYLGPS